VGPVDNLIELSHYSPELKDESKHLKIEKIDSFDEREIEIFLPRCTNKEEAKEKLFASLAENQARINALEISIKK
jgi:GTPase involved in cell partitioning and DNA repair